MCCCSCAELQRATYHRHNKPGAWLQSKIQGILFDKDGTLLDYHKSWAPINRDAATFAAAGDADLAAHLLVAGGLDNVTGRYRSGSLLAVASTTEIARGWIAAGSPFELATLTRGIDTIFRQGVGTVVPVTELAPFFLRLRQRGLRLGIASSDSEAAIRMTCERFGLTPYVDFCAGYDSGFGAKPAPGMLLGFAAHIGVPSAALAVIGDNRHDMEMGRLGGAGLCVAVLTGTSNRAELAPHADLCLDSICDLEIALFGCT